MNPTNTAKKWLAIETWSLSPWTEDRVINLGIGSVEQMEKILLDEEKRKVLAEGLGRRAMAEVEKYFDKVKSIREKLTCSHDMLTSDNIEYCPCGNPVTGDYGICSSPQCK